MTTPKGGRPRFGRGRRVTVAVVFDPDVLLALDAYAGRFRLSRSLAVEVLLSGGLGLAVGVDLPLPAKPTIGS